MYLLLPNALDRVGPGRHGGIRPAYTAGEGDGMTIAQESIELLKHGTAPEEVVSILGVRGRSHNAVRRVLKEIGHPVRNHVRTNGGQWSPEEDAKLMELRGAGLGL